MVHLKCTMVLYNVSWYISNCRVPWYISNVPSYIVKKMLHLHGTLMYHGRYQMYHGTFKCTMVHCEVPWCISNMPWYNSMVLKYTIGHFKMYHGTLKCNMVHLKCHCTFESTIIHHHGTLMYHFTFEMYHGSFKCTIVKYHGTFQKYHTNYAAIYMCYPKYRDIIKMGIVEILV